MKINAVCLAEMNMLWTTREQEKLRSKFQGYSQRTIAVTSDSNINTGSKRKNLPRGTVSLFFDTFTNWIEDKDIFTDRLGFWSAVTLTANNTSLLIIKAYRIPF